MLILFKNCLQNRGPTSEFIHHSARASKIPQNIKQCGIYTAQDLFVGANSPTVRPSWVDGGEGIGTQELNCPAA